MQNLTITLTGTRALLMKSLRSMDPDDPLSQEMRYLIKKGSGRAERTPQEEARLQFLEFATSLYHSEEEGPYLPSWNIVRSLQDGAKAYKKGPAALASILPTEDRAPVIYSGPRDIQGLFDQKFWWRVPVNANPSSPKPSMVLKIRPMFMSWKVEMPFLFVEETMSRADLIKCAAVAGAKGIGDYRARFGKYTVEISG